MYFPPHSGVFCVSPQVTLASSTLEMYNAPGKEVSAHLSIRASKLCDGDTAGLISFCFEGKSVYSGLLCPELCRELEGS